MTTIEMLSALTANDIFFRIINMVIAGLDQNNTPTYRPEYHITIGQRGHELFLAIDDDLDAAVRVAFEWCQHENLIKTTIQ